jgi:transposase
MGKHRIVHLNEEQRQELEKLIHSGHGAARTQTRARILLLLDRSQGQERQDSQVAEAVMCSQRTVVGIRRRFVEEGLSGALSEKPRPGQRPKITGDIEAQLVMLACSAPPEGHERWTLRLLADRLVELTELERISHVAVGERLKKMNCTLAGEIVVHWQTFSPFCGQDGRCPGRLPATV